MCSLRCYWSGSEGSKTEQREEQGCDVREVWSGLALLSYLTLRRVGGTLTTPCPHIHIGWSLDMGCPQEKRMIWEVGDNC